MALQFKSVSIGALLLLVLVVMAFMVTSTAGINIMYDSYDRSRSHADAKHAADVIAAETVREAMCNTNNPHYRYTVGKSRYVEVCQMNDDIWGLQIWKQYGGDGNNKKWSEITAYSPDDIKALQDVINMCARNGWELVEQVWDPAAKIWVVTKVLVEATK